jgi:succinate dehydrogenase/fumarate reductase flavoprotein subunit
MKYKIHFTDVLVIGGGGAGLISALEAKKHGIQVTLVSKKKAGYANSTSLALGYVTYSSGGFDEDLFRLVINEGGFLNNQHLVEIFANDVGQKVREMRDFGILLQFLESSKVAVLNPNNPVPLYLISQSERNCRLGLTQPLRSNAENWGVKILDGVQVTKLLTENNSVIGATAIREGSDYFFVILAKSVVLATGGAAQIYLRSDNPPGTTGDGYALAYHAGAKLVDMEFVTFNVPSYRFGEINTEKFKELTKEAMINLERNDSRWGFDQRINAHYFSGGVIIDETCKTNLDNLYAAGEVTGGLFSAARLGGSALAELIVFGARAGKNAAINAEKIERFQNNEDQIDEEKNRIQTFLTHKTNMRTPEQIQHEIKSIMWNYACVARTESSLKKAIEQLKVVNDEMLAKMQSEKGELPEAIETINMLDVAFMVSASALKRKESRGAHWRLDYPFPNNKEWLKNIIIYSDKKRKMKLITEDIITTRLSLPSEVHVGTPWSGYFHKDNTAKK